MKITNPQTKISAGLDKTAAVTPAATASLPAQNEPGGAPDGVQLSNLGRYLGSASNRSPAHIEKLTALSGAISAGQYNVDPFTISGSLIQYSLQVRMP